MRSYANRSLRIYASLTTNFSFVEKQDVRGSGGLTAGVSDCKRKKEATEKVQVCPEANTTA